VPQMLIGGEQRAASASEELEVVNPATEEVVDSVPAATADDVNAAVEAAGRAFADWSRTDVEKRAELLSEAA
jgi:aldehyde dehydrogenase (NAD+)